MPAIDIAGRYANAPGRLRRAGDRGHARLTLDQQVIGLHAAVITAVAIAGDVAANQLRVTLLQRIAAETGTRGRTRREVLDEDIGAGQDSMQQLGVGFRLDVGDQRFLALVQPDKVSRFTVDDIVVTAGKIALGTLDLDNAGAGLGEPV